jgi:hypothetical protein
MMQTIMHSHYIITPVRKGQFFRIRDSKDCAEAVPPRAETLADG